MKQKGWHLSVRVKCVETSEEWSTIKDCAHSIGYTQGYVSQCIRFADPIDGKHYVKING